tara:strand:- start:10193 stop:10957 length:765 start_codon:yes stop_codon:yes gene_type:complete
MKDIENRVAIVTGGASGIGRSVALKLSERGAKISIGDLQELPREEGEETRGIIEDRGGEVIFTKTDISEIDQVKKLIERTVGSFGGIDILVNNAAADQRAGTVEEMEIKEWERVIQTNLTGMFLCTKYAIPYLKKSKNARIVNIASQLGLVGYKNRPAYCASKGGVINFSKQLAIEYADVPILVNSICPGLIQTHRTKRVFEDENIKNRLELETPLPYFGKPDDIAEVVAFIASDKAKYITGADIVVDGGYTAK